MCWSAASTRGNVTPPRTTVYLPHVTYNGHLIIEYCADNADIPRECMRVIAIVVVPLMFIPLHEELLSHRRKRLYHRD